MKHLLIFLLIISYIISYGQVQITQQDMPSPGDTIRISSSNNLWGILYEQTDTNHVWDFRQLIAADQQLADYVAISSTPLLYKIMFPFPAVATVANRRPDAQLAVISLTDGYTFYKGTASKFSEVGFGSNFNGVPLPVKYQSQDVLYHLPLNYGDKDSSTAVWNVSIPNFGSIFERKHRVTTVDGWGIIKLPMGSYPCLRLKSVVRQWDSIILSASPIPLPTIPTNYVEYIWLSPGIGFPVAKVTERAMNQQIEYMDTIKAFTSISSPVRSGVSVYPNPVKNTLHLDGAKGEIEIYTIRGELVLKVEYTKKINLSSLKAGVYLVWIKSSQSMVKIIKE
jgi:hypothetical protein